MMGLIDTVNSVKQRQQPDFRLIHSRILTEYPDTMKALRIIDMGCTGRKRRTGFNLVKRENKKLGYVYYVRYSYQGKMLPTKWNTRTNILDEAERFARENKERLVNRYLREHDKNAFRLFESFFSKNSEYLACEEKRNRPISDTTRINYHSVITTKFLPFLRKKNIPCAERISVQTLSDFQDYYLGLGIRPQTVNDYLKAIRRVFIYLIRKELLKENPCIYLKNIPVQESDKTVRGCYELGKLKGIFYRKWRDFKSYLLCLIIYTTGMRNVEIGNIRREDIVTIGGCRFIDIKKSKTPSGIRLVPLHETVYQRIVEYASGKTAGEQLFTPCGSVTFSEANAELTRQLEKKGGAIEEKNITFYSGRHYWKTMMNSGGLGDDVEEIFMGHRVSSDVAKLYNHKDKRGQKLMVAKAKQVFKILDKQVFGTGVKRRGGK
jgi:integrase